jgi:hypothetical protein
VRDAGIVDDDVEHAVAPEGRLDHRAHRCVLRHVDVDRDRCAAGRLDRSGNVMCGVCADVGDDNFRATLGEQPGDAFAETAAGARDDGDAILKLGHSVLLLPGT